jgi:hypothetical protein
MSKASEGKWEGLQKLEDKSARIIGKALEPYHIPVKDCYECGVEVAELKSRRIPTIDVVLAAMYLKRSLTDLRVIWKLLLLGYTSQAATVASATLEHVLISACLPGNRNMASQILNSDPLDSPFKVTELCDIFGQNMYEEAKALGMNITIEQNEQKKKDTYEMYKWMCKIKHPTLGSVAYSALASDWEWRKSITEVTPDARVEDLANKSNIIGFTVDHIYEGIFKYALYTGVDWEDKSVKVWKDRFFSIRNRVYAVHNQIIKDHKIEDDESDESSADSSPDVDVLPQK